MCMFTTQMIFLLRKRDLCFPVLLYLFPLFLFKEIKTKQYHEFCGKILTHEEGKSETITNQKASLYS